MIISFEDTATEDIYNGLRSKKAMVIPQAIWPVAHRKLDMIHAAHELRDLKVPPGNKLEALKGSYRGFHSIRVNDQFRIVFKWADGSAADLQITDYH